MRMRHLTRRLVATAALLAGLSACTPQPGEHGTQATGTQNASVLDLKSDERRYVIDDTASRLLVYTYRGGKLARFGHNHVLNARSLRGDVAMSQQITGSRFRLEVPFAVIEVDPPALRRQAGPEFESKPSPEDIAATRENMLGPGGLDIAIAPAAIIEGTVTASTDASATLDMAITVRKVTHRQSVEVALTRNGGSLRIVGATALRHSDFGIEPFSVMLGALTVKNKVDVKFDLVARPAT